MIFLPPPKDFRIWVLCSIIVLDVVLNALCGYPLEPLAEAGLHMLTMTMLFIFLIKVKRVGELLALFCKVFLQGGDVALNLSCRICC